jgi:sialate O-acetylesterase
MQIAPWGGYEGSGKSSAFLRDAQLNASHVIPNCGMACLMDLGEKNNIHPAGKETAANRLAYLALAKTYDITGFVCLGPELDEMAVGGELVKLTFKNAPNGLTSFGKELTCFEVAGKDRKFYPAKAFITGTGITLFSPSVANPVAVRYGFKNFVIGDLFNTEGLPASSFRTDDWDVE